VAPKQKISILRLELMGVKQAVRLARKIRDSLQIEFQGPWYFTDSSALMAILRHDSASFL
jgi:hypothetical protein